MRIGTRKQLLEVNRRFYEITAEEFDRTRQTYWPGWKRVLNYLQSHSNKPIRVLDVACGNGRLAQYLDQGGIKIAEYTGVDQNGRLLEFAQQRVKVNFPVIWKLEEVVTTKRSEVEKGYDLVTIFGLMHHVPSFAWRIRLIKRYIDQLSATGILAISFWQYATEGARRQRILSVKEVGSIQPYIDVTDLETGDAFLRWGNTSAIRYCHMFDSDEIDRLITKTGTRLLDRFEDDGVCRQQNQYLLLTAQ